MFDFYLLGWLAILGVILFIPFFVGGWVAGRLNAEWGIFVVLAGEIMIFFLLDWFRRKS